MKWTNVKTGLFLSDPEQGFSFVKIERDIVVRYRDHSDTPSSITFHNVEKFTYTYHSPYPEIGEGCFKEAKDSTLVQNLLEAHHILPDDNIKHYLLSTNDDEWCEVLASGFKVERE